MAQRDDEEFKFQDAPDEEAATPASVAPAPVVGKSALPRNYAQFYDSVYRAATKHDVDPADLFAVLRKESGGKVDVTGEDGHGQGPFQIDDRYHGDWLAQHQNGRDVAASADYAAKLLSDYRNQLQGVGGREGFLAAYNTGVGNVRKALRSGRDPDAYTTGGDYAHKVMQYGDEFRSHLPPWQGDSVRPNLADAGDLDADTDSVIPKIEDTPQPPDVETSSFSERVSPEMITNDDELLPPGVDAGMFERAKQAVLKKYGAKSEDQQAYDNISNMVQSIEAVPEDDKVLGDSTSAAPIASESVGMTQRPETPDDFKTRQQDAIAMGEELAHKNEIPLPKAPEPVPDFVPPSAPVKQYNTTPRDFGPQMAAAQADAEKYKSLNLIGRGLANAGAAIGGVKADTGFYDQLDDRAGAGLRKVQADMAADQSAKKLAGDQELKDPASARNRAVQDQFLQSFPKFAQKPGAMDAVRKMTAEQIATLMGFQEKREARDQTAQDAYQKRLFEVQKQNADNERQNIQMLLPKPDKGGQGGTQDSINERRGLGAFEKAYVGKNADDLMETIGQMEEADQLIPDAVRGKVTPDMTPDEINNVVAKLAPGLSTQITPDRVNAYRSAVASVEASIRKGYFGATLSPGEKGEFEKIMQNSLGASPAAQAAVLDMFRRVIYRKLQAKEAGMGNLMKGYGLGDFYENYLNDPHGLSTRRSLFKGLANGGLEKSYAGQSPLANAPVPQPRSQQAAAPVQNKAPVTPPPQPKPLSPKDQAALDWARKNPNDPNAKLILQHLGVQ